MNRLIARIKEKGAQSIFRKDETLFYEGEVPQSIYVVIDGAVAAYTINDSGNKSIANIFGRNSVLPITWANRQTEYSLFNYIALNNVIVLKISRDNFWEIINQNEDNMKIYIDFLAKAQTSLMLRIDGLFKSRAIDKIAYLFYFFISRYSVEKEPGIFEIDLKLTQELIAELTNQTREGVANNLKILKEKDIIKFENSIYTVNRKKLDQFVGDNNAEYSDLI